LWRVARILAIDLGEVRMGLAVSDDLMITAQPLPTWRRRDRRSDFAHLGDLVEKWGVHQVVVGYPRLLGGQVGEQAAGAQKFAEQLETTLGLPVILWDERYSTVAADRALIEAGVRRKRRQQMRDSVAALLILQTYLDRQQRGG
jgi:putative Holliday junction resolvase